jgi:hypothetical protein
MPAVRLAIACLILPLLPALTPGAAAAQPLLRRAGNEARPRPPEARRVMRTQRTTRAITIDGTIAPGEWDAAAPDGDFTQSAPEPGAPASQRSEARVLFDDQALFVAMRLYDSAPDSIVAPLARRDFAGYTDWAHVIIDSYNDRRTAFRFGVNPAGVKRDGYISGDQEFTEDLGWDAVWDAAVGRDSLGWTAEFRIPLSQLRFGSTAHGGAEWGIQFARDIARRSERSHWALVTPQLGGFVSRFGTLRGIRPPARLRRLELTPFTLGTVTHAPALAGDPFFRQDRIAPSAGLDLKAGLTSDLTLTATVLPDFGQVEADPALVNLSGIENFLAERRPFFTEGSDLFVQSISAQDWIAGDDQLFYSRRIGRAPQGGVPDAAVHEDAPAVTRLLGALKLSGKTRAGWSLGALSAVTEETTARWMREDGARGRSVVEPMSHYGVLRVARDVSGGEGTIGAFVTTTHRRLVNTGLDALRDAAVVGGVTARRRFSAGRWEVSAALVGSEVRGTPDAITATQRSITHLFHRPDARHLAVDSAATALQGAAGTLTVEKTAGGTFRGGFGAQLKTPGFEANDLGFVARSDVIHVGAWLGHEDFRLGARTRSRAVWLNAWNQTTTAGERMMRGARLGGRTQLRSFHAIAAEAGVEASILSPQVLRGGPALRIPLRTQLAVRYTTDTRRRVSLTIHTFYLRTLGADGWVHTVAPTITIRPSPRSEVQVGPFFGRNRLPWQYVATRTSSHATHFIVGDLQQTTSSLTARVSYAFSPDLSLQLYAQPFVAAGRFGGLDDVVAPRAPSWQERVRRFAGAEHVRNADGTITLGAGERTVTVDDPAFSTAQFRGNAVLRWEYRPGSTVFVVWAQSRDASHEDGTFDLARQTGRLFGDGGTNVLTVKWSHWLGR